MAREQVELVNADFRGGLVTETGPLGYPENSCKSLRNVSIDRDGSARVRNGLVAPTERSYIQGATSYPVGNFYWEDPEGDGVSFVVTGDGDGHIIANVITEEGIGATPSDRITAGWVRHDGTNYYRDTTLPNLISTANAKQKGNKLFLFSDRGVFYLRYLPNGNQDFPPYSEVTGISRTSDKSVEIVEVPLSYRDLYGVSSDVGLSERPTTLSNKHRYNLENAGWSIEAINEFNSEVDLEGGYPALSDYFWTGYNEAGGFFDAELFVQYPRSNSLPFLGHFILRNIIQTDNPREAASGLNLHSTPGVPSIDGPRVVGFFAGRVWYAGFSGQDFEDNIMFSQVLSYDDQESIREGGNFRNTQAGDCYQKSDPTAQDINDLVADDGGIIVIPGIGKVLGLVALSDGLLVISDVGTWVISGGLEPFSALSYKVDKVTSAGCVSDNSIVVSSGGVYYWGAGDIVGVYKENGFFSASSLSDTRIKGYYKAISQQSKKGCIGRFDKINDKVYWFYGDGRCLILDIVLNAFYPYDFGVSYSPPFNDGVRQPLSMDAASVLNPSFRDKNNADLVYSWVFFREGRANAEDYIFFYVEDYEDSGNYNDFLPTYLVDPDVVTYTQDTRPVEAHIEIGATNFGDLMRQKQAFRVFAYFQTKEYRSAPPIESVDRESGDYVMSLSDGLEAMDSSSCFVHGRWEWSSRATSGKWSQEQQAYRTPKIEVASEPPFPDTLVVATNNVELVFPEPNRLYEISDENIYPTKEVTVSRMRVRGSGKVLNLRFENERFKGFHLLAWAAPASMETRP